LVPSFGGEEASELSDIDDHDRERFSSLNGLHSGSICQQQIHECYIGEKQRQNKGQNSRQPARGRQTASKQPELAINQ
jgi:hypothetical protein